MNASVPAACQSSAPCKMGESGNDPFEFGGSFATAGKPFQFTGANTP
ncbi:hypothetical protein [Polyangium sp. 6x1]|nr:hypothetical protein [Polyangium sp. 6x1]MDI1447470.1 hypothetical protein [Polyangium sp. 6x1]